MYFSEDKKINIAGKNTFHKELTKTNSSEGCDFYVRKYSRLSDAERNLSGESKGGKKSNDGRTSQLSKIFGRRSQNNHRFVIGRFKRIDEDKIILLGGRKIIFE